MSETQLIAWILVLAFMPMFEIVLAISFFAAEIRRLNEKIAPLLPKEETAVKSESEEKNRVATDAEGEKHYE